MTKEFDVGALITAVLDAMVENVAEQLAQPENDPAALLRCQAALYEGIAEVCQKKAQLARAMAVSSPETAEGVRITTVLDINAIKEHLASMNDEGRNTE